MSKNRNKTASKIRINNPSPSVEGTEGDVRCLWGGAAGVFWASAEDGVHKTERIYCDFFESLRMLRSAAVTFSFKPSGVVR